MLGIKYLEWNYFDLKKIILIQRKKGKIFIISLKNK